MYVLNFYDLNNLIREPVSLYLFLDIHYVCSVVEMGPLILHNVEPVNGRDCSGQLLPK